MRINLVLPTLAAALATAPLNAQNVPPGAGQPSPQFDTVKLWESFTADGHKGQCEGRNHGEIITSYNAWSPPIRIDTDGRPGGCQFNIAVIDPRHVLGDWNSTWTFQSNGDGGQCGNQGAQTMQVVADPSAIDRSRYVRIDTDGRSGGCEMLFAVDRPGPRLLIYFVPDGDSGQCERESDVQVVDIGHSKKIIIDADDRAGGCLLQFRLR